MPRDAPFVHHVRALRALVEKATADAGLFDVNLNHLVITRTWHALQLIAEADAIEVEDVFAEDEELISP